MKASSKALLLSALVFPGAGQFFLKRTLVGTGLVISALAAFGVLASHTLSVSRSILEKMTSGEIQPDFAELTKMISTANTPATHWATTALVAIWIVSILDAAYAGRRLDKKRHNDTD